eukprot:CAMPEP_0117418842 /NCGR_PEP_ID=MMETSP0758-20121206/544_1 /TAXON_ID=63605 /ORGANISM="Percolomonas cosmopolitus, Strain AE-1 (ATCC 50343)" /LENGTH=261 /DNA_ID=CAMNT_0005199591 /DNA_START=1498 /DNA_END=2283 /DNA_ORIENTATION=-
MYRCIANISIDPEKGTIIANTKRFVKKIVPLLESKSIDESEELVLNVVRALTNLSYYGVTQNGGSLHKLAEKIATLISPLLMHDHRDGVLESARCFGNITRDPSLREFCRSKRYDEAIIILVEHSDPEIVEAVAGVLINLSSEPKTMHLFTPTLINHLFEALEMGTVSLATVILKIFHNLLIASGSYFIARQVEILADLISNLGDSIELFLKGKLENPSLALQHAEKSELMELLDVIDNVLHVINGDEKEDGSAYQPLSPK